MGNVNAITRFRGADTQELQDTLGITQFLSEYNWHHTLAGLLLQGGKIVGATHGAPFPVSFNVGFPKQVLSIFCQEIGTNAHSHSISSITTSGFSLNLSSGPAKDFYWWAIGV